MTREEAIINLKLSQNRIGGIKKEEWNALQMAIEALQTLEAVERIKTEVLPQTDLVRCKDCRHRVFTKDGESNPHDIVCDYHMSDGFDETDFCSYAERREP